MKFMYSFIDYVFILGYSRSVITKAGKSYDQYWINNVLEPFLKFDVKLCRDALLTFSATYGTSVAHGYECVIGASQNTRTAIRNTTDTGDKISVDTSDILSCDEFRPFWISFVNGLIQVNNSLSV